MRWGFVGVLLFGTLSVLGCGDKSDAGLVPVAGTIKVDGEAAPGCVVTCIPQGPTPGNGGSAITDSAGRYEIRTPQGGNGLPPGQYKVTISRRLNPDGTAPDPNVPPMESPARETIVAKFTDKEKTDLTVTVAADDKRSFDFAVQSVKKK